MAGETTHLKLNEKVISGSRLAVARTSLTAFLPSVLGSGEASAHTLPLACSGWMVGTGF